MSDFIYEHMTPELVTYYDQPAHPGYKYPKDANGYSSNEPTRESEALVDAWRANGDALREKLQPGELKAYRQAHKLWRCRDEMTSGEPKEHKSPNGKYRLVVTRHTTGKESWSYTKGRIYVGDQLIETVCRNYSAFPFVWVEDHGRTHEDYLICGEDYQGQTVVNLVTGNRIDHTPSEANQGHGFCWSSVNPNGDGTLLAVCGCYWACPYEIILVDFSDPENPPWTVLARSSETTFDGWTGPTSCRVGTSYEVVDLPGHPLDGTKEDDCSLDDLGIIDAYVVEHDIPESGDCEAGWKVVVDAHEWTCPPVVEVSG